MKDRNHQGPVVAFLIAMGPLAVACGASPAGGSAPTGGPDASASDSGVTGTTPSDGGSGITGSTSDDAGADVDAAPLPVVTSYISGVTVSTLAGSSASGTMDGTGAAAQFDNPTGMALDTNGNLLVTDYDDGRVRLVTPAGVVTTLAAATNFADPFVVVVATDGKYYVGTDADSTGVKGTTSGTIWLVTPLTGGAIATPTVVAKNFDRPRSLVAIAGGNLFVADRDQDVAETLTIASGQTSLIAGSAGIAGYVNATGGSARFNLPVGAVAMADGSFLVTDSGNNVIRRVTATGVVSTYAGNGSPTLVDGPCASASFNAARGLAVDSSGNVYVSDIGNHVIRRISSTCTVQTVAGNMALGYGDGAGNTAQFYGQEGIAVTPDGSTVYVADGNGGDGSDHQRIRAIAMPATL